MPKNTLHPYKFRITFENQKRLGSAIHTFYAPDQETAERYAVQWARRRGATRLTRLKKGK